MVKISHKIWEGSEKNDKPVKKSHKNSQTSESKWKRCQTSEKMS